MIYNFTDAFGCRNPYFGSQVLEHPTASLALTLSFPPRHKGTGARAAAYSPKKCLCETI